MSRASVCGERGGNTLLCFFATENDGGEESSSCGYVIHEASRKLNNKIITNSVHVRIEK